MDLGIERTRKNERRGQIIHCVVCNGLHVRPLPFRRFGDICPGCLSKIENGIKRRSDAEIHQAPVASNRD